MKTVSPSYSYSSRDEENLEPMLSQLERELGGERKPYFMRAGALDLLTVLEIIVSFTAGAALQPVISKYFEGLLNGDGLKNLGENHRQKILTWLAALESDIGQIIRVTHHLLDADLTFEPVFEGDEQAITLKIYLGPTTLHVVLNHSTCSRRLLLDLPRAIVTALKYLVEQSVPEETVAVQLYFDHSSQKWKYLFVPSPMGYGGWIDRYVDLDTQEMRHIGSRQEFLEFFNPDPRDRHKFLIDPFRDTD